MKSYASAISIVLAVLVHDIFSAETNPQQVHIASTGTGTNSSIAVTWITFEPTASSQVRYAVHGSKILDKNASGLMTTFKDGRTSRYVHRVTLQNLQPNTKYDYQCGSPANWSRTFTLKTLNDSLDYSPTFLVYGDFGYENGQSMSRIAEEVNGGAIDAILHIGDIAYDLFSDDGTLGDKFMNMIEGVATSVPYMAVPGNHEWISNFKDYRNRFSMPGGHDSIYYSWNVGPAHIIMFSTEVYFFLEHGLDPVRDQYEWLENDLKQATSSEALAEHPWIITMAHRPMYCSTTNFNDCDKEKSIIRTGLEFSHLYPLEKLFYNYGVDMCVWAHEHIYERLWPVYNQKVMNGSYEEPYTNPKAPVHIITGSAGCRERHDTFQKDQPEWVAVTSGDYGFSKMTIHNVTHLSVQQISDDQNGKIVDSFTIVKEEHGPMAYDNN